MMAKLKDETGNRYGRWTVLERVENSKGNQARWLCHCDCGNEGVVAGSFLRRGDSKSCGCLRRDQSGRHNFIDITGQKFGHLIAVRRDGSSKKGEATWFCRCRCGNTSVVTGTHLRTGRVRTCGCSHSLPVGEASFNSVVRRIKYGALKRSYEWGLSKEQCRQLMTQPCYYCGAEPVQTTHPAGCNGAFVHNGLDRTDNEKGYEVGNVVPCCEICNKAKRTLTIEQFRLWALSLYNHFVSAHNQ